MDLAILQRWVCLGVERISTIRLAVSAQYRLFGVVYRIYWWFDCLQGNVALEKSKHKKPFAWIPELGWEDAVRLAEVSAETFGSLPEDVEQNESKWKKVKFCFAKELKAGVATHLENLENLEKSGI